MNRISNLLKARTRWSTPGQAARCREVAALKAGFVRLHLLTRPNGKCGAAPRRTEFALKAAQFSLGRVLLHLIVLLRYRRHVHWHFQCICREFHPPRSGNNLKF